MRKEERAALLDWSTEIVRNKEQADKDFKELQDLSRKLGLSVWCCAETNYLQLKDDKTPYTEKGCNTTIGGRAHNLFERYAKYNAQHDCMMDLYNALSKAGMKADGKNGQGYIIARAKIN